VEFRGGDQKNRNKRKNFISCKNLVEILKGVVFDIFDERSSSRNFIFGNCPMSILKIKLKCQRDNLRLYEN
jgi:hypothetical protein